MNAGTNTIISSIEDVSIRFVGLETHTIINWNNNLTIELIDHRFNNNAANILKAYK